MLLVKVNGSYSMEQPLKLFFSFAENLANHKIVKTKDYKILPIHKVKIFNRLHILTFSVLLRAPHLLMEQEPVGVAPDFQTQDLTSSTVT